MLTQQQKRMLSVLIDHFSQHDVPPSFEELCEAMELKSKSGIHRLLTGLEERGYIRGLPNRARAIEVLKYPDGSALQPNPALQHTAAEPSANAEIDPPAADATSVPFLGKIAAGTPIEAISDPTRFVDLPMDMIGRGDYYALEIEGDSMIEAGILDGDTVIIERRDTAQTGDIVVALVDQEEATLKRFRRKGESIALEPANAAYETRIFGPDRVQVQGRLAGLLRNY
ncbi:MAG: transcriptional repressor LexA [Alphaproteobacteria bacterium]|nr:transcriptional repressor LexA [Alphaproteobacteria bacterium]